MPLSQSGVYLMVRHGDRDLQINSKNLYAQIGRMFMVRPLWTSLAVSWPSSHPHRRKTRTWLIGLWLIGLRIYMGSTRLCLSSKMCTDRPARYSVALLLLGGLATATCPTDAGPDDEIRDHDEQHDECGHDVKAALDVPRLVETRDLLEHGAFVPDGVLDPVRGNLDRGFRGVLDYLGDLDGVLLVARGAGDLVDLLNQISAGEGLGVDFLGHALVLEPGDVVKLVGV